MNEEPPALGELLRELLQHFQPAAAAEFSTDDLNAVVEELVRNSAVEAWSERIMSEMKIKSMDFRKGVVMELEPAQEMAAAWVAAARGLLVEAENYSESTFVEPPNDPARASYSMDVSIPELPERYTLTVQRVAPGKLTPHEARLRAEKAIEHTWKWIADVNDGLGYDTGDLGYTLEKDGFPPPPEDD